MAGKGRPAPAKAHPKAHVAIVVARWNYEITEPLASGAERTAKDSGLTVERFGVAGSFELPAAVAMLAETGRFDAVVPIGALIRGETPHFDVLSRAVADGLMQVSLTYPVAVPFGLLTCDTIEQAEARAGGREGNKGAEAMEAVLDLLALRHTIAASAASAAPSRATAPAGSTAKKRKASPGKR